MIDKDRTRNVYFEDGEICRDLVSEGYLNQLNGQSENIYYYKGLKCRKIPYHSKIASKLNGYALIKKDLKFVKKALTYWMDLAVQREVKTNEEGRQDEIYSYRKELDKDGDIEKSLYISSIITYSKAFITAEGKKVRLDHEVIFKTARMGLHKMHKDIIKQRNSYLAHAGETQFEKAEFIVLMPENVSNDFKPFYLTDTTHVNSWGKETIKSYLEVVDWVMGKVIEKLEELSNIVDAEIRSITLNEWKTRANHIEHKS